MRTYMARLGSFQFGMDTAAFDQLQRSSAYRWEAKNRIGRQPAMQNTGRDADTITLSGAIYPHWRGGLGQIGALRAMAESGEPQPLVYAFETSGQYCGQWCITGIEETRTVLFDNGAPRKIEFSLVLREYGEDDSGLQALAGLDGSVANVVTAGAVVSQGAEIAASVQDITTQANAVSAMPSVVSVATSVTDAIANGVDSVMNSEAVKLARRTAAAVSEIKGRAASLKDSVKAVSAAINDPSKLQEALDGLGVSAGAASEAMREAAESLGLTSSEYNGSSADTLHSQQIKSVSSALVQFSQASQSLQSTAKKLRRLV